jgi:hypothetical protein
MTKGGRHEITLEKVITRTIRMFRFADELRAEDLISRGGANDLKGKALRWAGGNMGLERWSSGAIRTPHGMAVRSNQGYEMDHAVPIDAIREMLDRSDLSRDAVERILRKYLVVYYISREEHARLSGMGLRSSMPPDWDGEDVQARYRAIGIRLECYEPGCGCEVEMDKGRSSLPSAGA